VAQFYEGAVSVRDLLGSKALYESAKRVMDRTLEALEKAKQGKPTSTRSPGDPPGFEMEVIEELI
jgi:hypothetical protein